MFEVVGGHHTDFTFTQVKEGREEHYGPFDTFDEAKAAWYKYTWLNVDDGQHRLRIVDLDPPKVEEVYTYPFPAVSATATVIPRRFVPGRGYEFLVGIRADDSDAYPGKACFPGGFLNAGTKGKSGIFTRMLKGVVQMVTQNRLKGETIEQCAVREIKEETLVDIREEQLKLFYVHSNPDTDPRAHVVNVCYYVDFTKDQQAQVGFGDDLKETRWVTPNEADELDFAFNHYDIMNHYLNGSWKLRE